ncbi:MAG: hypothetical protein IPJ18_19875 [Betaproteobacteria bacterium]|nr:hypothetical protein [Betaproteobacteria bacterium]
MIAKLREQNAANDYLTVQALRAPKGNHPTQHDRAGLHGHQQGHQQHDGRHGLRGRQDQPNTGAGGYLPQVVGGGVFRELEKSINAADLASRGER